MITREIKCPGCGAPHEALQESTALICEYCGAFMLADPRLYTEGEAGQRYEQRALAKLAAGQWADERKVELQEQMGAAKESDDRPRWRLLAREYWVLMAATDPDLTLGETDPEKVKEWVGKAVQRDELLSFDPEVAAAYAEHTRISTGLMTARDAVSHASRMMDHALVYARALLQHPDYQWEVTDGETRQFAADLVRVTVSALQRSLEAMPANLRPKGMTAETFERIHVEVLGERATAGDGGSCGNCGAQLQPAQREAGRCPYCGGLLVMS